MLIRGEIGARSAVDRRGIGVQSALRDSSQRFLRGLPRFGRGSSVVRYQFLDLHFEQRPGLWFVGGMRGAKTDPQL